MMPDGVLPGMLAGMLLVPVLLHDFRNGRPMVRGTCRSLGRAKSQTTQHTRDNQRVTHISLHFTANTSYSIRYPLPKRQTPPPTDYCPRHSRLPIASEYAAP